MIVGLSDEWAKLIDPLIPEIFCLIVSAWSGMKPFPADQKENPTTKKLYKRLIMHRDIAELPFRIDYQLMDLDTEEGEDDGEMDIVFSPTCNRENIYFCLECKRMNVFNGRKTHPYSGEYVTRGMFRFISGQYSRIGRCGGMLAYVMNGDLSGAMSAVERVMKTHHEKLGMTPPISFHKTSFRPQDDFMKETHHVRNTSATSSFSIYHLFVARPGAEKRWKSSGPVKKKYSDIRFNPLKDDD